MLSRARSLWRAARSWPVVGSLVRAADRIGWAHVITRAHVVDVEFVAAQLGRDVSERGAVRAYVRDGFRRGMAVNPLFSERTVSRQLSDADRVPALYAYLVNDRRRLSVSPHWDAPGYAERHPDALDVPGGPLGHAWRHGREAGSVELGWSTGPRTVPWQDVARTAAEAARGSLPEGEVGHATKSVAMFMLLARDEPDVDEAMTLAAEAAASLGADVTLVLDDPTPDDRLQASLLPLWVRRIRVQDGTSEDVAEEAARATQETVVIRGPRAQMTFEDLRALATAGALRPTAPLWLAPDGMIASAGVIYRAGRRVSLLSGHPPEDARALGPAIDVEEIAGPTRAWPRGHHPGRPQTLLTASVVAPYGEPDPEPVDAPDTAISELLAPAGLTVAALPGPAGHPPRLVRTAPARPPLPHPSLRWAIQTAAPAGKAGEAWGDTHFARGLAAALSRLGQQVVVIGYDALNRSSAYLDDVTLVLRGPRRIDPPAHGTTLLWIISHPDEITAEEAAGFDRVFAASTLWASRAASRLGTVLTPLLQCTDTTVFFPTPGPRTGDIVFVGTARGIARPSVAEPLRAGIPVQVYGPDWTGFIPASAIVARGIPHAQLAPLYGRSAVVLNDHWPAMRNEGFISNRPFDVVAAGGRVISDAVVGISDLFGQAVREYHSIPELIAMLRGDLDDIFPSETELALISERIRAEHSFDARARVLLEAALEVR